jgi:predicted  nucleic acid-binding Zn-ribbon protein
VVVNPTTIRRLSKGSLSTDVESMRTKSFDKCIKNEMEEDIRNEMKEIREEFMELQHQVTDNTQEIHNINTRNIPLNIQSKLIVIFSV